MTPLNLHFILIQKLSKLNSNNLAKADLALSFDVSSSCDDVFVYIIFWIMYSVPSTMFLCIYTFLLVFGFPFGDN